MSRRKRHELRSAMFQIEQLIPKADHTKATERERDLVCQVNCAIWDSQPYKISAGLRRLSEVPERGEKYGKIMELLAL